MSTETEAGENKVKGPQDTSVGRALKIIELMIEKRAGWTISELSQEMKVSKSTVSYLLNTLDPLNYIHYNGQTKRYTLGSRLFNISGHAMHEMQLRDLAHKYLENVVGRTGLGANLGILDHTDAVYIDRVEPQRSSLLHVVIWIGRRMAPQITAVGKALICQLDKSSIKEIMAHNPINRPASRKTILNLPDLYEELVATRSRGYAIDDGEHDPQVRCVAAPVYDASDRIVAAISVNGTLNQLSDENLPKMAEVVKEEARNLSECLKSRGGLARGEVPDARPGAV